MSGRVHDRLVVVTGAAGGQGAAAVTALRDEGAVVIATDLRDAVSEIPERVHWRRLDVASAGDWDVLAGWLVSRFGRVDGLINNAGATSRARLADVALAERNRALAVNLTGPMLGIQTLAPLMGPGASIANVGSVAALTGHYTAAYTASKWGLRGLTRVAAMELGPRDIRVNAVHPGYIETPMTASAPAAFRARTNCSLRLGGSERRRRSLP